MSRLRIAVASERSSAYGRGFISGISTYAEHRSDLELALVDAEELAARDLRLFDGCICRTADTRAITRIKRSGLPTVDALCAVAGTGFASIRSDAEAIGQLAAEHFTARNFIHIGYCGYRRVPFSDRRRNAFVRAVEAQGSSVTIYRAPYERGARIENDVLTGNSVRSAPDERSLTEWLMRLSKPAAVLCCDDQRAAQLAEICRQQRVGVPGDVAILGIDNDPIYCMFSRPRLSSIDPGAESIGEGALALLDRMMHDSALRKTPPVLDVHPRGVVVRASTDTYPGAPDWLADALTIISDRACSGLTAAELFARVGLSRTCVEGAFQKYVHRGIKQRIVETRLNRACQLLRETAMPIKAIADQAGFGSDNYFINTFTTAYGISPKAWREANIMPGPAAFPAP